MATIKPLTQAEAKRLLEMVKYTLVSQFGLPNLGETASFDVEGDDPADRFTITVFRGKINAGKQNFSARVSKNNAMLLELHIGATNKHFNVDGSCITGSHWHIFREGYDLLYAYPAGEVTSADFVANALLFLQRFHVVECPEFTEQLLLDTD